jgi:hypothetical protein
MGIVILLRDNFVLDNAIIPTVINVELVAHMIQGYTLDHRVYETLINQIPCGI